MCLDPQSVPLPGVQGQPETATHIDPSTYAQQNPFPHCRCEDAVVYPGQS